MGHSETIPLSETVFDGKRNKYELREKLGGGGNGKVYSVLVLDPTLPLPAVINGYAIKVFSAPKDQNKREKRFIKEINTVLNLQDRIEEIVPIYDYSLGDGDGNNERLWYLMPKAESYNYLKRSDSENLTLLRRLGDTIAQLHEMNFAHRDIKIDNILLYDNKLYLSDFGLVWDYSDDQKLTGDGEGIGPHDIRPPELERYSDRIDNFDFRVSDVYLFAKTMWIILTRRRNGFKGEYSRGNVINSLNDRSIDLGDTLEPLHELMEKATKDDFRDRITINECLRLIDLQVSIFNKSIPQAEINRYVFEERIGNAITANAADDQVFRDETKKLDICRKLQGAASFVIDYGFKRFNLGAIKKVQYQSNNIFIISVKGIRFQIDVYVSIDSITIDQNNKCSCKLKRFTQLPDGIKQIENINELYYSFDKIIALDVDLEVCFVSL